MQQNNSSSMFATDVVK